MTPRPFELLVFDWDGTLMDSMGTIVACTRAALTELGLPALADEEIRQAVGLGFAETVERLAPGAGPEDARLIRESYSRLWVSTYREHPVLFPGAVELLADLEADGYLLAVATGKSRQGLERALDGSGLRAYFSASRCADESTPKPHPAMLYELMQALEAEPGRMLMVGDTSHDLQMAAAAGVDAVAVTYGAHAADGLRELRPRACVGSVAALQQWLQTHA